MLFRGVFRLLPLFVIPSLAARALPPKTLCEMLPKDQAAVLRGAPVQIAATVGADPQRSCLFVFAGGEQMYLLFDPSGTPAAFPILSPASDSSPEAFRAFFVQSKLEPQFIPGLGTIAALTYENGDKLYLRIILREQGLLTFMIGDYPKERPLAPLISAAQSIISQLRPASANRPSSIVSAAKTRTGPPSTVCDLLSVDDASTLFGARVIMANVAMGDPQRDCMYTVSGAHGLLLVYNPIGAPMIFPVPPPTSTAEEFRHYLQLLDPHSKHVSDLGSDAEFTTNAATGSLNLYVLVSGKGSLILSAQNPLNPDIQNAMVNAARAMLVRLFNYVPPVDNSTEFTGWIENGNPPSPPGSSLEEYGKHYLSADWFIDDKTGEAYMIDNIVNVSSFATKHIHIKAILTIREPKANSRIHITQVISVLP